MGSWSNTRRNHTPIGMLRLSHRQEGGADASTEVIDASSPRSLTTPMGLWSERPHDGPELTGQPTHCGRVRAAGAGGRSVLAPAGDPRRYGPGQTAMSNGRQHARGEAPYA